MNKAFHRIASWLTDHLGTPQAILISFSFTLLWMFSGPVFHYSDTWQLIANTATTLVTFHLGFIILYSGNRDTKAVHLKLDEIIRSIDTASNEFIAVEMDEDEELETLESEMEHLHEDMHRR